MLGNLSIRRFGMKTSELTYQNVHILASNLIPKIARFPDRPTLIYGVPRGGISAAYALIAASVDPNGLKLIDNPGEADLFMDDIIDSGTTRRKYEKYGKPFLALIDKTKGEFLSSGYIVFPWDQSAESSLDENIRRLIQAIDPDPQRGGLIETPERVAKAWKDWSAGYTQDPATILKQFEDGAENYDQMIVVKSIPFYSHCEHHLAPFFGSVTIGYIPDKRIVGLSKLSRLTDIFAKRLQVQERMTGQIADAMMEHLQPQGVGVYVQARHLCMESRGVRQQGHETITTAIRGVFQEQPSVKSEFLSYIK